MDSKPSPQSLVSGMHEDHMSHESLVRELQDDAVRAEYAAPYDHYKTRLVPRVLAWILVSSGNLVYGAAPSYGKFKAIEVIARIPYQSWEVATYTLLTAFYGDEQRAITLSKTSAFSRAAQDNETMHVVVITQIAKRLRCTDPIRHLLIPLVFAFFYFWTICLLYLLSRRAALELNYLFESHAYEQYSRFVHLHEARLRTTPVSSDFLSFYGRECRSEYELFTSIRNDELVHRNRSIKEIELRRKSS
jgi:ubiquinol oxidase